MTVPPWLLQQFPDLSTLAPLAEGGQKWVFTATHVTDGAVVLKVIKPNQDAQRVQREALAVQQVGSKRVPPLLAAGVLATPLGECIWLREQHVAGESVRRILGRGPLSKPEVIRLGEHVLEALADVERARIVHRDVKPDNIIRGSDGNYWLLDFGIARHLDLSSLTATAAISGPATLGYAPPEQLRNRKRDIDVRADLFALGVTLVECLTGSNQFTAGARDAGEILRRVETQALLLPTIPDDPRGKFADLLRALTQKRMDCRPPSAAEALQWLREVINGG